MTRVKGFGDLMILTLRRPDRAMAILRGLDLTLAQRWGLLLLVTALSALLAGGLLALFPATEAEVAGESFLLSLSRNPLGLAVVQFVVMGGAAVLLTVVGRAFRGEGDFADCLLALAWVDAIILAAQVGQVLLILVLPSLVGFASIATLALSAYLVVRMTGAVHGFTNPFAVALGILATLMLTSAVLSLAIGMAGFMPVVIPEAP